VALSCSDGSGAGCAVTKYCLGSGCTPATVYTGTAIIISASTDLRFYSSDNAGNNELIQTSTYTINSLVQPVPNFGYSLGSPNTLIVNVDGSASTCRGTSANCGGYDWNWGDYTANGTGVTATHTYATGGTFTITLKVTDAVTGAAATISKSVTVTQPNRPPVAALASGSPSQNGWTVSVTDASTDPDGNLTGSSAITVQWGDGTYSRCAPGGTVSRTYVVANTYTITLTATDSAGLSSSVTSGPIVISLGTVTGTVKNGSNQPINLAKVTLTVAGSTKTAYTNSSGVYTISNVQPGTGYPMAVYNGATLLYSRTVTINSGTNTVNFP